MEVGFKVDISEAVGRFKHIESRRVRYRVRTAMKKAIARKLRSEALRQAKKSFKPGPEPPGLLDSLKSPKTSIKTTKRGGVYTAAGLEPVSPHAHLVEFGHNSRRNGPVEGKYFMTTAGEKVASVALDIAVDSIEKSLARELKKSKK